MIQRILIIDDDADMRRMMRLTLETAGYEVGEAADGPQGLAAFGDGATWDLMLLDQMMPGMEGLEVLRGIEARAPTTRVIMVTAFASIDLVVEVMKLGATDFLCKPITPESLVHAVDGALVKASGTPPVGRPASDALSARLGIKALTRHDFRIERVFPGNGETLGTPGAYQFIVRSSTGSVHTVVVEVSPEAVTTVEQATHRPCPPTNTFWASYAERRLATYLWDEGHIPYSVLTITRVALQDVHIAFR